MKNFSIALTAATLATVSMSGSPAWATDGGTAIDMCKKLAHCVSSVSSKGDVLIFTIDGHTIACPSTDSECEIIGRPAKVAVPPGGGTYQPPPSLVESEPSSGEAAAPASQPAAAGSGPIF
jgi:hypothetical protein